MNRQRSLLPLTVVGILWVAFAGYVWQTGQHLPERVATHFGPGGGANGWMSRSQHIEFTIGAGLAIALFILGIFALIRYMGDGALNIPRKDYWLAPGRREETYAFIQRKGYWFAGIMICFLAAIHHSILAANTRSPVTLPNVDVAYISGTLLVVAGVWVALFIGHFYRKPQ